MSIHELSATVGRCIEQIRIVLRNGKEYEWGLEGEEPHTRDTVILDCDEAVLEVHWEDSEELRGNGIHFFTNKRCISFSGKNATMKNMKSFKVKAGYIVDGLTWDDNAGERTARLTGITQSLTILQSISGRYGGMCDQLTLRMFDGRSFRVGAHGGGPMSPRELDINKGECVIAVTTLGNNNRNDKDCNNSNNNNESWRGVMMFKLSSGRMITLPENISPPICEACITTNAERECSSCNAITLIPASNRECIVNLVWSNDDHQSRDGYVVNIVTAPKPPIREYALDNFASIYHRGLPKRSRDKYEEFALNYVIDWLGEDAVLMQFSQAYAWGASRAPHSDSQHQYSPPKIGFIGETHIDSHKIVKIALNNPTYKAMPSDHRVVYHGMNASTLLKSYFSTNHDHPKLLLRPGWNNLHGVGVYTTPSFTVGLRYAYSDWMDNPRYYTSYEIDRDHPICVSIVAMCASINGIECPGSAFSDHLDGWDHKGIEILNRDQNECQVYALLFCFFDQTATIPEFFEDTNNKCAIERFDDSSYHLLKSVKDENGNIQLNYFRGFEKRVIQSAENEKLFVRRDDQNGTLLACSFCQYHCSIDIPNHDQTSNDHLQSRVTCFVKRENVASGLLFNTRFITMPRCHIGGISSPQFWTQNQQELRSLLRSLRSETLKLAAETHPDLKIREAKCVFQNGVWQYDVGSLRRGDVLLIFHSLVSREHLHLNGFVCEAENIHALPFKSSRLDGRMNRYNELGTASSYSVSWRHVFELASSPWMFRDVSSRSLLIQQNNPLKCKRAECQCSLAMRHHWVSLWDLSMKVRFEAFDYRYDDSFEGFCCEKCKNDANHHHDFVHI